MVGDSGGTSEFDDELSSDGGDRFILSASYGED